MNGWRSERFGPWLAAATFVMAFAIIFGGIAFTIYQQRENRARIAENEKTALALCGAAAGARDFWIGVRDSTIELLQDPTLSPIERSANKHYVEELGKVILAAHDLTHFCDDK